MMTLWSRLTNLTRREKNRVLASGVGALITIVGYSLGSVIQPGPISYIVSVPALVGIFFTCLARVNDLGPDHTGWKWNLRRIGLTIAGASSVAFLYAPFSAYPTYPTWLSTVLLWGVFLTWVTTPSMPPWHKYISGEVKALSSIRKVKLR